VDYFVICSSYMYVYLYLIFGMHLHCSKEVNKFIKRTILANLRQYFFKK